MKLSVFFAACLLVWSHCGFADDDLVEKVKAEQVTQKQHQESREAEFAQQEQKLARLKHQLEAKKQRLTKQNRALRDDFSRNEKDISDLEKELTLESGSLGEVFSVARHHAKELNDELTKSISGVGQENIIHDLENMLNAESSLNLNQLIQLWHGLVQQIDQSKVLQTVTLSSVDSQGVVETKQITKFGSVALIGDDGYLDWDANSGQARNFLVQPQGAATLSTLNELQSTKDVRMVLDPTRGQLLNQLTDSPTILDRIEAGGIVGNIIVLLLGVGLVITAIRGAVLFRVHRQISAQLKYPGNPQANPLGRILSVYHAQPHCTVETLELRLLEVILDEQAKLEKGLSMLKLLAALAPMLGLLGTVTGMIDTFHVITLFGSGDATVMAGGISMALVTTVMGLVAAMPLLLAHNILSTQAENIRNLLEKQGVALVAKQAEQSNPEKSEAVI